jgi:nitrite reductase/ring-hydroxylating ferredoxin subunit
MEIRLEGIRSMAHGESRTFAFLRNGRPAEGFLIRHGEGYFAYLNQCRHWYVPLDLGDADFYSPQTDRIMCKTHGAVYQVDTGLCDYGPCVGAALESFPVALEEDRAVITVPG